MNLKEFMANKYPRNAYVDEPGWESLYVRKGTRFINGIRYENVFDLANIEVKVKEQGTFTRFIERFQREYPGYSIYIENVFNHLLHMHLLKTGFKQLPGEYPHCYFLEGKNTLHITIQEHK